MTRHPIETAGARIWICDDCGRRFNWDDNSYWYGSWKDWDEGNWAALSVYCGCRPMPKES